MDAEAKIIKKQERQQYIFALRQMVSRDIKRKYSRSKLGIVWSVLNPLMTMAVMSMIFTTIFKREIENFPIYYMTGHILWDLFTGITNSCMTALSDNKKLLVKVKMSKHTFIVSKSMTALTNFSHTCIAFVLMLIVFQIKPTVYMLLFPIPVIFLLLLSTGIGYILSILFVFFGDVKYLYSVAQRLLMYMCALFYPITRVTPALQNIIKINPIYSCIDFGRSCILYGQMPELRSWINMIAWSVALFVIGYVVFNKKQNIVMQKV